jgi:SWI/SNF-related matrix-associated actin-dependent regulator 1 of chromatin subfamily A
MVLMGILKKIAARGKVADVIDHIQEVVDAGEKIVVFAWHKEIVQELKKAIPNAVTLVGDDSMEERQRAVDSFQSSDKVQVILCNIKSGGVGITLTASSRVAFIELPWHPADADQCEDRCHRIGQKDSVQCSYFLGHNTIDEYIYGLIEKKRKIANEATGAEDNIETNVIDEFINLFKQERIEK